MWSVSEDILYNKQSISVITHGSDPRGHGGCDYTLLSMPALGASFHHLKHGAESTGVSELNTEKA